MKILHVDTEKGWRGGEQQLFYLVRELKRKGHAVAVACRCGEELERRCRSEGIDTFLLKGNTPSDVFRLGLIARAFDAVHAHSAKAHTLSVLSKKFHNRPVIYTRRVDYRPKRDPLTEFKYKKTDAIVAVARFVKEVLEETFPEKRVKVIYSAVDLKELQSQLSESKVELIKKELGGSPLIGSFAALTPQKNIPNFIEAALILKRKFPRARFVVFGEGKLRKELELLVRKKHLDKDFILYGFVEDVANYMKALDLFLLPSDNEGIGGSTALAMALKVPVVSTDAGGVPEVVIDRKTGLIVPKKNPKALAAAVEEVLTDESLREKLVKNAYQFVSENLTVDRMVRAYEEVYREVVVG